MSDLLVQCRSAGMHGMHVPSSTPPPSCENCILGKQTQSPVPKVREGAWAGRRLGIIHVDLMEHPDHVSSSGNHYVLNIIDDFLSFCWSIPLSAKSNAFPAL